MAGSKPLTGDAAVAVDCDCFVRAGRGGLGMGGCAGWADSFQLVSAQPWIAGTRATPAEALRPWRDAHCGRDSLRFRATDRHVASVPAVLPIFPDCCFCDRNVLGDHADYALDFPRDRGAADRSGQIGGEVAAVADAARA